MPIDLVMDERDGEGKPRTDSIGSDDSSETRGNIGDNGQVKSPKMMLLMLVILPVVSTCHTRVTSDKIASTDDDKRAARDERFLKLWGKFEWLYANIS